ncbi:hypothetical protein ACI7RC_19220 [Brevibacillus sp. B_LB10_24]|uniref:hypothetical protein n=1 Tax=Brevibacillus sp. B_LB10_24 TaxID=3380645 RepID=UPI0038BDD07F
MKKFLAVFLITLFIFSSYEAVFAFKGGEVNREKWKDSKDNEQIANLADDIVKYVNSVVPDSHVKREIAQTDIHFDDAVKIYVDVDVFRLEKNTKEELKRHLDRAECMWELPIYVDSSTVIVTISKVKKAADDAKTLLTPEQKEYAEKNEGKWEVSGVKTYPGHVNDLVSNIDHMNKIPSADTQSMEAYVIGGIPNVRIPVILLVDEAIEKVIFTGKPVISANIDDKLKSNTAYNFDEVASIMKQIPVDTGHDVATGMHVQESTPGKETWFIFIGIGLVGILMIAIVLYQNQKSK